MKNLFAARATRGSIAGLSATALAASALVAGATAAGAADDSAETVFEMTPSFASQGNYPSQSWQYGLEQLGDLVVLGGEARIADTVSIWMNSHACESSKYNRDTCESTPGSSFSTDMTLRLYAAETDTVDLPLDGAVEATVPHVGEEIASVTQAIEVPYRGSADATCEDSKFLSDVSGQCEIALPFKATFDLSDLGLDLPEQFIVAVDKPAPGTNLTGDSRPINVLMPGMTSADPGDYPNYPVNPDFGPSVGSDPAGTVMYVRADSEYGSDLGQNVFGPALWGLPYRMAITVTAMEPNYPGTFAATFESESVSALALAGLAESAPELPAAAGCFYATAPITNYGTHGADGFVVTKYAGYSDAFPDAGYFASADFYLDAEAPEGQFSWSHALNDTDGNHEQDFVFHVGADGDGTWTVGTSHGANTNADENYVSGYGDSPVTITDSGWYTLQHTFEAVDGAVVPTLAVLDATGAELGSWVMDGTERTVGSTGGNRYGWLVNNSYEGLPIDNVLLNAERPSNVCGDEGDGETDGGADGNTDGGDTDGGTDGETDGNTDGDTDGNTGDATATSVTETVQLGGIAVTVEGMRAADARELIAESSFTAAPGDLGSIPANVTMPHGAAGLTLAVEEGSTATVTFGLPSPVTSFYKNLGDGWVEYPATFEGTTVVFEITDGGAGDADGEVNGVIVDPAAPALTATFAG